MAEINIHRKAPLWPWIVGIAALFAVIFVWAGVTDDGPTDDIAATGYGNRPTGTAGGARGAVDDYLAFAGIGAAASTAPDMGREHEYTAEGLRKLSAAINALVTRDGDGDSRTKFDGFRQAADRIQQDPASLDHANQVRDAFMKAADTIASLDDVTMADQVRSAAQAIDADKSLLEQREAVRNFFRESARAIQSAARG